MVAAVFPALLLVLALAGCAASARYTPAEQPAGVRLAADYRVAGDTLRVWVESGGYRVEDVLILRPDGAVVRPLAVEPPGPPAGSGLGIGVGGSVGSGGDVAVGTGIGVGIDLGGDGRRHAVAVFPLAPAGPPPWSLHLKVVGIQPVVIVLPPEPR